MPASRKHIVFLVVGIAIALLLAFERFDRFPLPAYQSSAVARLRIIYTANEIFSQRYPQQGYAYSLEELADRLDDPEQASCLVDPSVSGEMFEYGFRYVPHQRTDDKVEGYEVFADPLKSGKSGVRHFFLDQTGVVRMSETGAASGTSRALK